MFAYCLEHIVGKKGLEIGGPSWPFSDPTILPIYHVVGSLDGINFARQTIWEARIIEGPGEYKYNAYKQPGYQYIGEAQALPIPDESYDFVLSSHCLEHSANPIQVLMETKRVLKPGGVCIYILPDKESTFDHRREVTKMSHLIEDYEKKMPESDMTHLAEILSLHDLSMDPPAGDLGQFTSRCLKNLENRGMHQHVFDPDLLDECFEYVGMPIIYYQFMPPYHQIVLAQKSSQ